LATALPEAIGGFYADKERREKRDKKHGALKIQMPVSHRICTKVKEKGGIRATEKGHRGDIEEAVQTEECRDNRSGSVPGSYPHAGEHPTVFECSTIYGVSQGKE